MSYNSSQGNSHTMNSTSLDLSAKLCQMVSFHPIGFCVRVRFLSRHHSPTWEILFPAELYPLLLYLNLLCSNYQNVGSAAAEFVSHVPGRISSTQECFLPSATARKTEIYVRSSSQRIKKYYRDVLVIYHFLLCNVLGALALHNASGICVTGLTHRIHYPISIHSICGWYLSSCQSNTVYVYRVPQRGVPTWIKLCLRS